MPQCQLRFGASLLLPLEIRHEVTSASSNIKSKDVPRAPKLFQNICESLKPILGKPMDPELSEEYKPEIDAINARDQPISFAELHERLLNREAMIL